MTNHIHLLVTPRDEEGCSLMMRDLGRDYAAYFNRRYERTGSLWERPFRSCLVDSSTYVLACYRYVERNPVRAHLVEDPAAYAWSSHAGNAAIREDRLLTPHPEYVALGVDAATRKSAYVRMLTEVDGEKFLGEMRDATHAGCPMVGDRLKARLEIDGARLERGRPGPRDESEPGRIITDVVRN